MRGSCQPKRRKRRHSLLHQAFVCGLKQSKRNDFLFYIGPCFVWFVVKAREASGILFYMGPCFAWFLSVKTREAAALSSTSGLCFWDEAKQVKRFSLLHRPLLCVVFFVGQSKGSKRHSLLHRSVLCVVLFSQSERSGGILFYIRLLFVGSSKARETIFSSTQAPALCGFFSSVKARDFSGILFYIGPCFAWFLPVKAKDILFYIRLLFAGSSKASETFSST